MFAPPLKLRSALRSTALAGVAALGLLPSPESIGAEKQSPDVSARDAQGNTPLHLAALRNDVEAVRALLANGADAKAVNDAGATPLHYGTTDEQIVAALLAGGTPPNVASKLGVTPLLGAVAQGDSLAVARRLIAAGAEINLPPVRSANLTTSVLANAIRGGDRRTVELLLEHGAEVNTPAGALPLMLAAVTGDVEITRLLLERGAKVNHRAGSTASPLAAAALSRSPAVAALLLEHGADPNARWVDRRRMPAIVFAGYNDTSDPTLARLLVERGADINAADEHGETSLSYALKRGSDTPLVRFLREAGGQAAAAPERAKIVPSRSVPTDNAARAALIRDRVQRSIDLLQPSSRAFLATPFVRERNCTSCHHQSLPAVSFSLARERGLRVDEPELGRTLHAMVEELRARTEHARQMLDPVPGSRVTLGYTFDALHALRYPRDAVTDAMSRYLLAWQHRDGSWKATTPRGPMEDQLIVSTAWSVRAIQLYPPTGREPEVDRALARARKWLHAQKPSLANDRVHQLLGLAWANETPARMRPLAESLIAEQRDDGGWAQLDTCPSDAWATGTALEALHKAGIPTSHAAYQRGLDFLLRTQFDDGSWWVRSRSWPVQPHFDSNFPHGKDQWISAGATAWAVIVLSRALEPQTTPSLPNPQALIATFVAAEAHRRQKPDSSPDGRLTSDAASASGASTPFDFARDVHPLFERSCAGCHVGEKIKGGLSLASRESLLKGGNSGEPAIVPGRSRESLLLRYISDELEDLEMPPLDRRKKYPPLTVDEIARVRTWIDAGAPWAETKTTAISSPR